MIAVDTTALSLLFVPGAATNSWRTKKPIKYAKERIEALASRIAETGQAILIPTPVLSELIVKVPPERIEDLLSTLNASAWFRVEAFDYIAAVELGVRTARAIASGDKKEGLQADWTKVKFDRQIITIAMVNGASEIISDDSNVIAIGERWNHKVTSVEDLPIPAEFIPPPLLAGLESESDEEEKDTKPSPTDIRRSGNGHPEGEAGSEESRQASGEETSSEDQERSKLLAATIPGGNDKLVNGSDQKEQKFGSDSI